MEFFTTPSWSTLSGIFVLSLILFGAFIAIIYDQQGEENHRNVRIITVIYAALQIILKVFLVIGIFKITGGTAQAGWGLFIGYILVLVIDIPTIALASIKRLSRGYEILQDSLFEDEDEDEDESNEDGSEDDDTEEDFSVKKENNNVEDTDTTPNKAPESPVEDK